MKKGFTLIELLAVIIILAIVALIATPIILNVVEDARISAGRSEASMIYSGINNYCATEDMKYQLDNSYDRICTNNMNSETVSQMVNLGNTNIISINYDGTKLTNLVIESNSHTFTLCGDGTFVMDDNECSVAPENPKPTTNLVSTFLKQYNETNETGLVKDSTNNNIYYYTGTNEEVNNNYLWYAGHQWRVVEIDIENDTLLLISQQPLTAILATDTLWTDQATYESSYINSWLNDYFYNSLASSIQNSIVNNTFNIGIYTDVDEITTIQKVGLLDASQYIRAGGENSYLDLKDYWYIGNRYDSSKLGGVGLEGDIGSGELNVANFGVRPVIKITGVTITGGNGTLESSYEIGIKANNISDVQIGEYINVPYSGSDTACGTDNKCTFRVVSKDSDSIKVVLNGLLSSTSQYGDTTTITTNHTIYTLLNEFANNISSDYRYTDNKTFYIGDYSASAANYLDIKDETLLANVGLPTVGEMFSGNDIDISTSDNKTFVNETTIENLAVSNFYWLMNRYDLTYAHYIYSYGHLGADSPTNKDGGIRPVIFLKNNLNFVSGQGTAESPYEL